MHSQKRTNFFDTKVKRIVSRDTKLEHHGRPWRKSDLKQCISCMFFSFIGISVYNAFFRIVSDFSLRTILSNIPMRKYLSFLNISRFLSVFLMRFLSCIDIGISNALFLRYRIFLCGLYVFWVLHIRKLHHIFYIWTRITFYNAFMFSIIYPNAFSKTH